MTLQLDPAKSLAAVLITAFFAVSGYLAAWASATVAAPVRRPFVPAGEAAPVLSGPSRDVPPPPPAFIADVRGRPERGTLRLRFSGAGEAHRVAGHLEVGTRDGPATRPSTFTVRPFGADASAVVVREALVEFSMTTIRNGIVGMDLEIEPPDTAVTWDLRLDGDPWPDRATVAAGAYGLPFARLRKGMTTDAARAEAYSPVPQVIDPATDLGMFVHFDRPPR